MKQVRSPKTIVAMASGVQWLPLSWNRSGDGLGDICIGVTFEADVVERVTIVPVLATLILLNGEG